MRFALSFFGAVALSALLLSAGAVAVADTRIVPQSMGQLQLSFADVVKKTAPAVVNIYSKRKVRNPFADDPFFRRFFGDRPRGDRVQSALGSGVIVRSDGIIVTNNHVVADADEIVVALADRREFEAKVLLADERTDIAVLRVNTGGKALPTLAFHNSDDAEVGDIVLAIGNPFGVGQTVTSGIISALARTQAGISDYQFFIQTDAAINPGNSGGALVTINGQLIGINSAIYSRSGGSIGIGFAIPANMVKLVVTTAVGGGKTIARPWLGLDTQPVTADIAKTIGLDRPLGVLVTDVSAGSPAFQAGLRNGDVIVKIDDFDVNDQQSVNFRVATKGIGNSVEVAYLRDGEKRTAPVRLIKAPETTPRDVQAIDGANPLQGVKVANMSPAYADELQVPVTSGVMITEMDRRSIAARLGFRPGDVIVSVNGRKITTVEGLKAALSGKAGRWTVNVNRNGQTLKLSISI
jgi:Do/DeqQ family serine protease